MMTSCWSWHHIRKRFMWCSGGTTTNILSFHLEDLFFIVLDNDGSMVQRNKIYHTQYLWDWFWDLLSIRKNNNRHFSNQHTNTSQSMTVHLLCHLCDFLLSCNLWKNILVWKCPLSPTLCVTVETRCWALPVKRPGRGDHHHVLLHQLPS